MSRKCLSCAEWPAFSKCADVEAGGRAVCDFDDGDRCLVESVTSTDMPLEWRYVNVVSPDPITLPYPSTEPLITQHLAQHATRQVLRDIVLIPAAYKTFLTQRGYLAYHIGAGNITHRTGEKTLEALGYTSGVDATNLLRVAKSLRPAPSVRFRSEAQFYLESIQMKGQKPEAAMVTFLENFTAAKPGDAASPPMPTQLCLAPADLGQTTVFDALSPIGCQAIEVADEDGCDDTIPVRAYDVAVGFARKSAYNLRRQCQDERYHFTMERRKDRADQRNWQ